MVISKGKIGTGSSLAMRKSLSFSVGKKYFDSKKAHEKRQNI